MKCPLKCPMCKKTNEVPSRVPHMCEKNMMTCLLGCTSSGECVTQCSIGLPLHARKHD